MNKHDAIIIGKGPAGIQASLYVKRAGFTPVVVGHDAGSLALAEKIENYYGLPEPISGAELQRDGEAQALSLGVDFISDQAVGVEYTADGEFVVQTAANGDLLGKTLLLATGSKRKIPPVDGIARLEGKGVSYCAVCDGFLYRGKKVGVLGHARYAFAEARELAQIVGAVTILTNGEAADFGVDMGDIDNSVYEIIFEPLEALEGEERLTGVRYRNGSRRELDGLFVAYGIAGGSDLARKLGIFLKQNGDIITEADQSTNVPGVFAAGDCTGTFRQISVAVGQATLAAQKMIEYIRARSTQREK